MLLLEEIILLPEDFFYTFIKKTIAKELFLKVRIRCLHYRRVIKYTIFFEQVISSNFLDHIKNTDKITFTNKSISGEKKDLVMLINDLINIKNNKSLDIEIDTILDLL